MRIVSFQPEHLSQLVLQDAQAGLAETILKPEYGHAMKMSGPAFSIFDGDKLVACCGAAEHHPQRVECWGLLSGRSMAGVTKAAKGWLLQADYKRIECVVPVGFDQGDRWAQMLGFRFEGYRTAYMPDGSDVRAYVILKD